MHNDPRVSPRPRGTDWTIEHQVLVLEALLQGALLENVAFAVGHTPQATVYRAEVFAFGSPESCGLDRPLQARWEEAMHTARADPSRARRRFQTTAPVIFNDIP